MFLPLQTYRMRLLHLEYQYNPSSDCADKVLRKICSRMVVDPEVNTEPLFSDFSYICLICLVICLSVFRLKILSQCQQGFCVYLLSMSR